LSLAAIAIVITQGALGGITVLYFLPWYISSAHAVLAQTFFSIVVLMALYTGRDWTESTPAGVADERFPGTRMLAVVCIIVLYLQLFFGAAFRHSGISIVAHLINAVFTAGMVTWTCRSGIQLVWSHPFSSEAGGNHHPALMIQLGFGFAAYLTRAV